ncbi:hypothetical protein [Eudoraea chungangensis]|uniref:hypothetical protein n=1 Tax=Eudoraea chungangensis TaxID=1481905 RepID=UPI0023EC612C|nr:hypothetical protein [Eudoraea chungangensis]
MKKLNLFVLVTLLTFGIKGAYAQSVDALGALEFSPMGILFAGDNLSGSIHAFDLSSEAKSDKKFEINVYNVDAQIAAILGTAQNNVQINDMAVHPVSGEVYLSVTRGHGMDALPALVKVNAADLVENVDLETVKKTTQALTNLPDGNKQFVLRGTMAPPTTKEIAKSKRPMRMLSILDMEYFKGELFVAGISNEDFCSVLRRMSYPFNGKESISNIEMYHIAHDEYETRAPIRSMLVKNIDGVDQMVAAYTCSPVVLIPLTELKDGAKVKANTIGDMGNGQPIDMVSFNMMGNEMLFVTNNSRMPQVIPLGGLNKAKVVNEKDFERGQKADLGPELPYGPMGKAVMFAGSSLQIDLLNEGQFVSLTRDALTGSLDLETTYTMFPNKLNNLTAEMDFPGYKPPTNNK